MACRLPITALFAVLPFTAVADEASLIAELTNEFDAKYYERLAGPFSHVLREGDLSSTQIDYRLRTAARRHAECTVGKIVDAARDDGRNVEETLRAVRVDDFLRVEIGTIGDVDALVLRQEAGYCARFWVESVADIPDTSATRTYRRARFDTASASVWFEAPDGFEPIGKTAIGNRSGKTRISYDIKDKDISRVDMEKLSRSFQRVLGKSLPDANWKRSALWQQDGRTWVRLEVESSGPGAGLHKDFLVTGLGDKMLVMHFDSSLDEFEQYEQALHESIESIEINVAD